MTHYYFSDTSINASPKQQKGGRIIDLDKGTILKRPNGMNKDIVHYRSKIWIKPNCTVQLKFCIYFDLTSLLVFFWCC